MVRINLPRQGCTCSSAYTTRENTSSGAMLEFSHVEDFECATRLYFRNQ